MKTPSSKARAYSRFIPREDVGEFTLWRFAAVDGSDALLPKPDAPAPAVDPEAEAALAAQVAAEKAARQCVIADHAQFLFARQRLQFGLVAGTVVEVVLRLQAFVARQVIVGRYLQCLTQARGAVVGRTDGAHLAGFDQARECAQGFFQRYRFVVFMCLVQVHIIGLQARKRTVDRLQDVLA